MLGVYRFRVIGATQEVINFHSVDEIISTIAALILLAFYCFFELNLAFFVRVFGEYNLVGRCIALIKLQIVARFFNAYTDRHIGVSDSTCCSDIVLIPVLAIIPHIECLGEPASIPKGSKAFFIFSFLLKLLSLFDIY